MFLGLDKERMEWKRMIDLYPMPRASYSQLSSFLSCPHTFYLTYIMKNYDNANKYTELGSLLHEVFERQGKQLKAKKPFSKAEALKMYNKLYFRIDKKHFEDKEDWVKMYQKGVTAIENYYSVYAEETPLYLEKELLVKIGEGIPNMKGFIDRIDGDPEDVESWVITDYKTGGQPKTKQYLRDDFQLGIYVAQIFALYGKYPKAVQFFHPVPNKFQTAIHIGDGVYKFQGQRAPVVEFSVAQTLVDVRETVRLIVECVQSGEWKKSVDSWGCKNCFHYDKCKPFDKAQEGWGAI
jgi:CRISPR/Cas system-associated exonuclease Cas4 (RecB family)